MYPKKFRFMLVKDSGVTGNLEVTIGKNNKVDKGAGEPLSKVHSKRSGQGYPHSGWEAFHERLEKGMKEVPA